MSTPITIFGSTEHLSGDNLPPRIENLNDKVITTESILSVNPDETVNANPVSAYGKTLLDTTSLADLRATILENTSEEAIRLLADGNNEINFYTGGTGASNLKMQIKDSSIELKNGASLTTFDVTVDPNRSFIASYVGSDTGQNLNLRYGSNVYQQFDANGININQNVVFAQNKHLKQKIEDSGSRVLVESLAKQQYCLYSYETGSNSGLLVQARRVGTDDIMEINNYRNSDNTHQPISINRSIVSSSYVVCGAGSNPTTITSADFVSNGRSVFSNGADVLLDVTTTITPYKNIIPSGSIDIGSGVSPFNNLYNNISTITNEIRMNTFAPVGTDFRQKGIFFRDGFNSISNGDNMCIRSIGRYDPGPPAGNVGDRLMLSAYSGLSINYFTNNAGNDGTTGRIALFHNEITVHKNILPNADGTLDIGFKNSGIDDKFFSNIYGNNLWAKTSLHTAQIRAFTNGNPIHFHNTSITSDSGNSIAIDRLQSTALGTDLFLGNDSTSKLVVKGGVSGNVELLAPALTPAIDQTNSLGDANKRFADMRSLKFTASTKVVTPEIENGGNPVECNGDFRPATDNTRQLGGQFNRWNEIFCTNTIINTSDRNAKKDITPITDALQFVRKLKPVQYKWKENSHGRTHTGFIAQDVLEASPLKDQWAGYIDTGNGLGLRYAEFISVNTQGIKELDEKLTKLQKSSVIIHEDGETKSDVNYHTDTSELYERIEALEQQIEEMGDSIGENVVQNVIEIQSDDDRTELTEELERLSRKNDKLEETLTNNDAVIQELVNKINVLENRLKQKQDEETEESEGGINMVEMLQNRNYEMEQRINKLEKQNKKLTSNLNKILKQLKNDTN